MHEKFLLEPKRVIPESLNDRPVFFLAGPIRGGGFIEETSRLLPLEK